MLEKISRIKRIVIIAIVVQILLIALSYFVLKKDIVFPSFIVILEGVLAYYLVSNYDNAIQEQAIGVKASLGQTAEEAYLTGGLGLVMYDDDYVVTWMSELFDKSGINRVGHKVLTWIPEADDLIAGRSDTALVPLDDKVYEISRVQNAQIIIFKDITELNSYKNKYENEQVVYGLASFDNYEESTQYLDEAEVSTINTALRSTMNEYSEEFGIMAKRLNSSSYLLLLDESIFANLVNDKFSILNKIRKAAQENDILVTLSMAFARGSGNMVELEEMASNLMDLAVSRGGDQVAMQKVGEDVKYFGGSSEAAEKRSKVRVRVMSHALRDLIASSSNVIICGHRDADFDCIGSALCLSQMAKALHKQVSIIAKTGGIEEKLAKAMKENAEELNEEVNFVSENEAINQLQDNTLVIMTDHHNKSQSNGSKLLDEAKKVVIIDHHRRSTEMGVKPVLVYIEAAASSTCELVSEMMPYVSNKADLSELDATFMLAGMIIDTQNWRVRTGSRTYEAASYLRQNGADPQLANQYLKDTFDEFSLKSLALANSERYDNGIIIAPVKNKVMTRSLMSQVADNLLNIQGVNGAFVIADNDKETCISARSNGKINVQVIMEAMGGGGHLASAAVQRSLMDIDVLKEELITEINNYFDKEASDESNT